MGNAHLTAGLLVVFAATSLAFAAGAEPTTGAGAEVFTHKLEPSPPEYYSTGLVEDATYAAAGITEDPNTGDPIDPPLDWSYSYPAGSGNGDLSGMAQAWAAEDELKSYLHLYADKDTVNRVKMEATTECWYAKEVKFEKPSNPGFWAGTGGGPDHTVQLQFRVTGNIQENDISGTGVMANVRLQLYNDNANPPELEGEGYGWEVLISDMNAGVNDVDSNGDYDKTVTYTYHWVDANWNDGEDYNGELIPFKLKLRLSAEEGNIDGIGEGDVVMDFTNTCVLESAGLYEDGGESGPTLLAAFDADGNVIGGAEQSEWVLTPEPATMALLALGGVALLRRRRR